MRRAIFTKDVVNIDKYLPDMDKETTLVIHSDVFSPVTKYNKVGFIEYSKSYDQFNIDNIVIVGMNRIRTPERRYDLVFPYIYNMNNFENKFTIDERPFNGEPWRVWYHYGFLHKEWLGTTYSNALESNYQHLFLKESDESIVNAAEIMKYLDGTWSDLPLLDTKFEFYIPDILLVEAYNSIKEWAFDKYSTPKQLIQSMLRELNKHIGIKLDYETYLEGGVVKLPDFGIYRFVAEENERRMSIYNAIVEHGISESL